ncbi:phosphomevalonate kinase [Streptomyces longwoodensis]|uniref:phosphomevalonate kinase n=1 Tax=Streptomyces longwoodensis TaxID=68231 RepID=UPI002DD847E2|nr:phosphomevalonate kinase [Streptomyces longwoodensis]WRY92596.1 phosphomevalonate kinase [Streptomyces longwoodensis]
MNQARTVVRHAPGKLYVAGEYAVVEPGHRAVLVAVDRHVTVAVTAVERPGVVITSDLLPRPEHYTFDGGRLGGGAGGVPHVVAAIETVAALLADRGLEVPGLEVSVTSTLHEAGTKYGLGSSGAVTVAAVAAVAAACGLDLGAAQRLRLALLASARIDAGGSGGDLAASTYGGWIAYRAPDRAFVADLARRRGVQAALEADWPGLQVRRLPAPRALSLHVGWSGSPASTTSLVAALHRKAWRGTPSHQKFLATSADFVTAAIDALEAGDDGSLLEQIRRSRQELARLDDEVGLGIFTPALTALCDAAESAGGAAKPSGAGGGDCGIALLDAGAAHHLAHVHQRWAAAGVLPLPVAAAPEGNRP